MIFLFLREKLKKLMALETARAAVVTQWTKKVIIEKSHSDNVSEPLVIILIVIFLQPPIIFCDLADAGSKN